MKDDPVYAQELARLPGMSHSDLIRRIQVFMESYGDHDEDCALVDTSTYGRDAELAECACGYVFRWELLGELERRLMREARAD
jgi:hypothetical protein